MLPRFSKCKTSGVMMMLVKLDSQKRPKTWMLILGFFLMTVVPWIVMIWLLWPAAPRR